MNAKHLGAEKPLTSPGAHPEIRARRKLLGLTIKQLAAEIPMDYSNLCRVERGVGQHWKSYKRKPKVTTPETLARIETALTRLEAQPRQPLPAG